MIVGKGELQCVSTYLFPGNQTNLLNRIRLAVGHRTMTATTLSTGAFSSQLQKIVATFLSILPADGEGSVIVLNVIGYCIQHLSAPE